MKELEKLVEKLEDKNNKEEERVKISVNEMLEEYLWSKD